MLSRLLCKTRQSQECNIKPLDLSIGDIPGSGQGSHTNRPTTRQPARNGQRPVPQTNALCRLPFIACACSWQYKDCLDLYSKNLSIKSSKVQYHTSSTLHAPFLPFHFSLHFDPSLFCLHFNPTVLIPIPSISLS